MTELESEMCLHRRHCVVVAEHADHEPQALEQDGVVVFSVGGVCRRAGVRVQTRRCASFCIVPADLEARPRALPP